MKKILTFAFAALALAACTKEQPQPAPTGEQQMTIKFSPYEMSPMKTQSGVGTVCSRLDVYIIEQGTTDTLRLHQERTATSDFGTATVTLQTNRTYRLVAMAHNTTDTCTFRDGVFSFAENKVKQCMVADTVFSPGDGLSLTVVMQRIVGMFKLRVTDALPTEVTGFRFTVDAAGCKWNTLTHESADRGLRLHTINGTSADANGVVIYNVYVMGDDMTTVKYVDITAEALRSDGTAVETREFAQVPIKDNYVTTYSGTFFVTLGMGFTFEVGDWNDGGSFTF